MRRLESISLSVDVLEHPKVLKLAKRLGDGAVMALFRLWIWVGKFRPEGVLDECSAEDVETIARWTGKAQLFVETLVQLKLLDTDDLGFFHIHDWKDHNRSLFLAQERSDIAKKAAKARWEKKDASAKQPPKIKTVVVPSASEDFGLKIYYRENVMLTERQHKNLLTRYGDDKVQKMYDRLSQYKKQAPLNHKRYPSDYQALLSWVADEFQSEGHKDFVEVGP